MTIHTEDALGCARIAQVFDLSLAVAASEALSTEGLITGEDGEILNFVTAGVATIGTVATDQGTVAEEE